MHLNDCLGGYTFFDEKFEKTITEPRFTEQNNVTKEIFSKNTKILEINSKTGLYALYCAYSVYKMRLKQELGPNATKELQKELWNKVISENIYVICKTKMAKAITRRTLAGFTDAKINAHYFGDLVNSLKNESDKFVEKVTSGKCWHKENTKMEFDAVVGNPPYQENISNSSENDSLSKQLFPLFIRTAIELKTQYVSLITPSRWFTADAQDKSFVKLREYVKKNNHFKLICHYPNNSDLFKNVLIAGGVNYFLYDKNFLGKTKFIEQKKEKRTISERQLFEEGLDIIISMNELIEIVNKVRNHKNFNSMTTITSGRNAYGIVGKKSELSKIARKERFADCIEIRCAYEEILYTERENVTKNIESINKWKIFTSKGNGGAGILGDDKPVAILGKAYIGKPNSVCTDSLIPIGKFDTENEALNLQKYMTGKFFRFMVGVLKVSQNVSQNVYQFVPLQDFTTNSDIDWSVPIPQIDAQLYKKYNLTPEEIAFIEKMVKPME